MTDWTYFILGEAELRCEDQEDAELLLQVCKKYNISCNGIDPEWFEYEPYWYVKNRCLITDKIDFDDDDICSLWSVKDYIKNHEY